MRRRRQDPRSPLLDRFERVVDEVERAKALLVRAVPSPRGEPGPLADSVVGFEEALRAAGELMDGWRRAETEDLWSSCAKALDEAAARAERLRLEAPALDYESLVYVLGDLIAPLDAFEDAQARLPGR